MSLKNPMTPARVEPATFRFVAQHLNHCATAHHLDSWINIDQLDVTCFIISLFTAQRVSNVSTSIFRSLLLIEDLFHVLYCSGARMCRTGFLLGMV